MRAPNLTLAGNLRWTRSGTVWADWLLSPLAYGFRPDKDKDAVRTLHRSLFRSLPGELLLLGLCAGLDPAAVVERMVRGVDLHAHPDWAAECEATLDTLDAICPGQRVYWLSVPLGEVRGRDRLAEPARAAFSDLRDALGLPRAGVTDAQLHRRAAQARTIAEGIPAPFRPRPVTPAQMVWLHLHAQQRGLFVDVDLPDTDTTGGSAGPTLAAELLTPRAGSVLGEAMLDEGGQSDLPPRSLKAANPLTRRYLKVSQPDRVDQFPASYQSMLVLSDVPSEGMQFPGSEFLGRIDESGIEVDWALRLLQRSSAAAQASNRRSLRSLNEQFSQRDGEVSHGLATLDRAAAELADYAAVLEEDKHEVELQATTVFAVAGQDPDTATSQARALADFFAEAGYKLTQPLGYQEQLWWAMTPGAPAGKVIRDYAQITTSRALSAAVPLASTDLGDWKGSLLGLNVSTGRPGVVLHDPAGASAKDVSGSMGIAGELGSGKSLTLKKLAGDVVDTGGVIVVPDRTAMGEWAEWAASVTVSTIVDVADPKVSLDPLRLFGAKVGARVAQSFLTPLLNIAPTSERGVLLAQVLDAAYLREHDLVGLGQLLAHLEDGCTLPGAAELGRVMNVYARNDFGRVVFDSDLPPLQTGSARAVIVRTHTLQLPSRDQLEHKHLFDQMSLEKTFGRAMYALIAALARRLCFANRHELGVFVVDEAHHITASPEGELEIVDFIRDGRKHAAAVFLGSHDPEADFGSSTLRGLIPTRLVMRQRDVTLARRSLDWLGVDASDEALLKMLMEDTSPVGPNGVDEARRGEGFLRDSSGNIGRVKVLAPALPARSAAARTSPPEVGADAFAAGRPAGQEPA